MTDNPANPDEPTEELAPPRPLGMIPERPHGTDHDVMGAIALVVIGYFGYSVTDLCGKYLQQAYSVHQILGLSGLAGTAFTGMWLYLKHGAKAFVPANLKFHLIRGLLVCGISFFMVSALKTLPLADFYGIAFTIPFLAMVLSVIVLKEKVGWRRWSAASVAFAGVIILAGPKMAGFSEGIFYVLCGVCCSASNMILVRMIGAKGPLPLYGFYPFLFIGSLNLAALFLDGGVRPITPAFLPWYLVHGPVMVAALLASSIGFARAPETSVVAPFQYSQVIWGTLFGWVFFNTLPVGTTWAGLMLVIGAGLYTFWREYRIARGRKKG